MIPFAWILDEFDNTADSYHLKVDRDSHDTRRDLATGEIWVKFKPVG
jgi:hypothetical protein